MSGRGNTTMSSGKSNDEEKPSSPSDRAALTFSIGRVGSNIENELVKMYI